MYSYKTRGICAREILFDLDGDKVKSVQFIGGCNGNTKGIAALVEGMKVDDVIARLENIKCGPKNTSCPAQLCEAIKEARKA